MFTTQPQSVFKQFMCQLKPDNIHLKITITQIDLTVTSEMMRPHYLSSWRKKKVQQGKHELTGIAEIHSEWTEAGLRVTVPPSVQEFTQFLFLDISASVSAALPSH